VGNWQQDSTDKLKPKNTKITVKKIKDLKKTILSKEYFLFKKFIF